LTWKFNKLLKKSAFGAGCEIPSSNFTEKVFFIGSRILFWALKKYLNIKNWRIKYSNELNL